jgi:hypothetical protein
LIFRIASKTDIKERAEQEYGFEFQIVAAYLLKEAADRERLLESTNKKALKRQNIVVVERPLGLEIAGQINKELLEAGAGDPVVHKPFERPKARLTRLMDLG